MRRRAKVAVSARRSPLSALANAEAAEHEEPTHSASLSQSSEHVAGQEERAHRPLEEADVLSACLPAVRGSASLCRPDAWA